VKLAGTSAVDAPDQQVSIETRLTDFLRTSFLPARASFEIEPDTDLFASGVVDSAGLLAWVAFMETEFGLTIPDEDLLPEHFVSVASASAYLRARQSVRHSALSRSEAAP
jgi:acyl carrier protein